VGIQKGQVREIGVVREGLDLEDEGWGRGSVATQGVAEEEAVGQEGVVGEEEAADGGGEEVVGAFEDGGASVTATGGAVADEEAGDMLFDEAEVEIVEQMAEALVGSARSAGEEADEGVEDDEAGIDALDGLEEGRGILWEGERMGIWCRKCISIRKCINIGRCRSV
jgi:hypothetical protein